MSHSPVADYFSKIWFCLITLKNFLLFRAKKNSPVVFEKGIFYLCLDLSDHFILTGWRNGWDNFLMLLRESRSKYTRIRSFHDTEKYDKEKHIALTLKLSIQLAVSAAQPLSIAEMLFTVIGEMIYWFFLWLITRTWARKRVGVRVTIEIVT